jgi:hypothetical protein
MDLSGSHVRSTASSIDGRTDGEMLADRVARPEPPPTTQGLGYTFDSLVALHRPVYLVKKAAVKHPRSKKNTPKTSPTVKRSESSTPPPESPVKARSSSSVSPRGKKRPARRHKSKETITTSDEEAATTASEAQTGNDGEGHNDGEEEEEEDEDDSD